MQLIFLILVFYCCIEVSCPIPPPYSDSTWRSSRYIIDNRRNALFSKKPLAVLLESQENFSGESINLKPRLFEGYQKDLTAEASFSDPKFYQKYGKNALPRKIVKSLRIDGDFGKPGELRFNVGVTDDQRNSSGVLDPQNFIQNEVFNEFTPKTATSTEKMQPWIPEMGQDMLISVMSSTSKSNQGFQPSEGSILTTTSFPWELENTKAEEGNQIDNLNEKHIYETRIETVSYHQEVMLNSAKKQNWFHARLKKKPESYEVPEQNYENQEKNYEVPEQNYENQEKNYEVPDENHEEPEKKYQLEEDIPGMGIHPTESEENRNKFAYVVEEANYRKYRVEERTVDGFIVGEYGVVSHDDGSLRGVRYTADSNINPQLIYETLIKFLSL